MAKLPKFSVLVVAIFLIPNLKFAQDLCRIRPINASYVLSTFECGTKTYRLQYRHPTCGLMRVTDLLVHGYCVPPYTDCKCTARPGFNQPGRISFEASSDDHGWLVWWDVLEWTYSFEPCEGDDCGEDLEDEQHHTVAGVSYFFCP